MLKQQARPANGNQAKHRYAGLHDLPRECGNDVHSYDPLLERQKSCGICVPWVSPEWKILIAPPTVLHEDGAGCSGAGVCRNCEEAVMLRN